MFSSPLAHLRAWGRGGGRAHIYFIFILKCFNRSNSLGVPFPFLLRHYNGWYNQTEIVMWCKATIKNSFARNMAILLSNFDIYSPWSTYCDFDPVLSHYTPAAICLFLFVTLTLNVFFAFICLNWSRRLTLWDRWKNCRIYESHAL